MGRGGFLSLLFGACNVDEMGKEMHEGQNQLEEGQKREKESVFIGVNAN